MQIFKTYYWLLDEHGDKLGALLIANVVADGMGEAVDKLVAKYTTILVDSVIRQDGEIIL